MDNILYMKPELAADGNEGLVFVNGSVNDNAITLLFDTGAATSTLELNETLGDLPQTAVKQSSGSFSTTEYNEVTVNKFQVGFMQSTNLAVHQNIVNELNSYSILGMDMISNYAFVFDIRKAMIQQLHQGEFDGAAFYDMELGDRKHFYLDIKLNDINAKALWDSGASVTVVDRSFISRHPSSFKFLGIDNGTDSGGVSQETDMYMMAGSLIGDRRFKEVKVASVDLGHINSTASIPMDMILGYSILAQGCWYLDFVDKKWRVELYP